MHCHLSRKGFSQQAASITDERERDEGEKGTGLVCSYRFLLLLHHHQYHHHHVQLASRACKFRTKCFPTALSAVIPIAVEAFSALFPSPPPRVGALAVALWHFVAVCLSIPRTKLRRRYHTALLACVRACDKFFTVVPCVGQVMWGLGGLLEREGEREEWTERVGWVEGAVVVYLLWRGKKGKLVSVLRNCLSRAPCRWWRDCHGAGGKIGHTFSLGPFFSSS